MNEELRAQIYNNLISRETEDLLDIWQNGDTTEWEAEVFEILREILLDRLGYVPSEPSGGQVSQHLADIERHLDNGELDEALAQCNLAIQMKPGLAIAYIYRGSIYDEMGQLENAIINYQKAIQLDPEQKDAWDSLAPVEAEMEAEFQESAAKQYLDQALDYAYDNQPERAWEECETAKVALPSIAIAYNYLGMILQTLDRLEAAIDAYLKAVELNPRFYPARENLANARIQWEEEQYSLPVEESPMDALEAEEMNTEFDESGNLESIPQYHYMDRTAFLLPGWAGHRTRQGRSGYDPLDTDFEFAHMQGTVLRLLFAGKFRTHNQVYLLLMIFIGLIYSMPLLGLMILSQEKWILFPILLYSPYWIAGIALLVNAFLSSSTVDAIETDEDGPTFF